MADMSPEILTKLQDLFKGRTVATPPTDPLSTSVAMKGVMGKMVNEFDTISKTFIKDMGEAFKIGPSGIIKILTDFGRLLASIVTNGIAIIGKAINGFADILNRANTAWQTAFEGGAAGVLTAFKNLSVDLLPKGPIKDAVGSFLDNVIKSLMFRFEEGLRFRQIRREAEVQMGFNTGAARQFASYAAGFFGPLGRDMAAQWGQALVSEGVTQASTFRQALGVGVSLGLDPSTAAKLMRDYMTSSKGASQAVTDIEMNFRKLAATANQAGLSVKMMADYTVQASKNARFLNIDIAQVGNMMANMAKMSGEFAKFGIDFRQHGATIANEFAAGGKEISDAMHVWYGSKGGALNISTGEAWVRSVMGDKAVMAMTTREGGGFAVGGTTRDIIAGNTMMVQRLETMKDMMQQVAAGATTPQEAIMLQTKMAKQLGMSHESAVALATMTKSEIANIAKQPELANKFKSTNQILGEMMTSSNIQEQIQRLLAQLNQKQLETLLRAPEMTALAIAGYVKGDTEAQQKLDILANEQINDLRKNVTEVLKVLPFKNDPAFKALETLPKRLEEARDIIAGKKKRQAGGPFAAGEEFYMNTGEEAVSFNRGGMVIPAEATERMLAAGGGSASPVNITLNVQGATIDEIIKKITDEVYRAMG